jgi:hypothetical protein
VFAVVIPLNIISMLAASLVIDFFPAPIGSMDFLAIFLAGMGVFVYNWFETKPCQISIEHI